MSRVIRLFRVKSVHASNRKPGNKKDKGFRDRACTACDVGSTMSMDELLHRAPCLSDLRPHALKQGLSVSCEVLDYHFDDEEGKEQVDGDFRDRSVVISYRGKFEYYTTLKENKPWELCDELLPEFERRLTVHFPRQSEPWGLISAKGYHLKS